MGDDTRDDVRRVPADMKRHWNIQHITIIGWRSITDRHIIAAIVYNRHHYH